MLLFKHATVKLVDGQESPFPMLNEDDPISGKFVLSVVKIHEHGIVSSNQCI